MTLRNQLKNVKIQNSETIKSYCTKVAQIKEQLEAVEEKVEEGECYDHPEWPPKIMGLIHSRNLCKEEFDIFQ